MKKCGIATVVVLVAMLAGCHAAPKDTKIDYLDRVYSKAEYLADANLRSKVLSTCDNNEGELLNDANCVNANLARMDIGNAERAKAAQKEEARLNNIK